MLIKSVPVGMLGTNCYIVCDEATKTSAVIDPGAQADKIMAAVEESGCAVKQILLTHGHYDHILAVTELVRRTGAPVAIHRADEWLLDCENVKFFGKRENYVPQKPERYLQDGMEVPAGGLTFRVLHTPGHTAGSCVFLCGDAMFSGDTLFQESCGRTDLESGDDDAMLRSLKRLYELEGDFRVFPGHESFSTLEHERRHNLYMREALRR
ncbi:MAG: MBL fold metallo-hydrolase [Clostridia bacterium]|nr:MBL fold metallo-hydrolase [Clostridia bacterium]